MNSAPCPAPQHSLDRLSDSELLAATRSLVGRSNQLLAALLAHLGEVEARGVHRIRACSSLYTYCIHELRLSEDEAYRRVAASRLVRRFPVLLEAIASGELHLTGLLMLGPHLSDHNLSEVLRRAKHRTKKEIAALVRLLDPLPDVPPRIEPLGPAPARSGPLVSASPSWSVFVGSLCPVRELQPGDRPRDWMSDHGDPMTSGLPSEQGPAHNGEDRAPNCLLGGRTQAPSDAESSEETAGAASVRAGATLDAAGAAPPTRAVLDTADATLGAVTTRGTAGAPPPESLALELLAPARLEPQRYRVQFTASEEYVKLVEEAMALLAHASPRIGLDEIHLRALRVLVAELKKRKYAVTSEPRDSAGRTAASSAASSPDPSRRAGSRSAGSRGGASSRVASRAAAAGAAAASAAGSSSAECSSAGSSSAVSPAAASSRAASPAAASVGAAPPDAASSSAPSSRSPSPSASRVAPSTSKPSRELPQATKTERDAAQQPQSPRQRGRYIPAAVRRAVFERDGGRCTYVSSLGERCREVHRLELHHLRAYALGGPHSEANLTLRCRCHNALAAEEELGRELIHQTRDGLAHEPLVHQRLFE